MTIDQACDFIKGGNLEELKEALHQNPELTRLTTPMGVSLLQFAAYCDNQEAIAFLRPLSEPIGYYEAASIGAKDRVEEFLQSEPGLLNTPGPDGFAGLGLASFFGHQDIAALMLKHKADPNVPAANHIGVYPIHSACAVSNYNITKLLLEAGADPNVKQQRDITPLHSAAHNGQQDLAELLLSYGADRTARTTEGQTAADMALEAGFVDLAALLQS